jgi:hypothetical protein
MQQRFSMMNLKRFAKSLTNSAASAFLSLFFNSWFVRFLFDKTRGEESHYSKIMLYPLHPYKW